MKISFLQYSVPRTINYTPEQDLCPGEVDQHEIDVSSVLCSFGFVIYCLTDFLFL